MDSQHFRQLLLAKEQELSAAISRNKAEALEARSAEVEDPIDQVESSEAKAAAFEENTLRVRTLKQVRDALARLDDGTYGVCIDCGRQIEPARLEAVPWTPYCLVDQERHDRSESKRDSLEDLS